MNISSQPLHFGWNAAVDIGSSNGTTGKAVIYDDHWKKINGTSSAQTLQKIESNDNFLNSVTRLIKSLYLPVAQGLNKKEQLGKVLVFFMPGQPIGNKIPYPNGLNTATGEMLANLDLNKIPKSIKGQSNIALHQDVRVITLNDVAGGLAKALSQMAQNHPKLFKPGMEALYLMSGGGLGVAHASYTNDGQTKPSIRLEMSEMADIPYPYPWKKAFLIGGINANVTKLLEDFTDSLPAHLDHTKQKFLASRNGKAVTSFKEASLLIPNITRKEYELASKIAINSYINMLAYLAALRVYMGTNLVIISGQVAKGVKGYVEQHPALFEQDIRNYDRVPHPQDRSPFEKVFLSRVWNQLSPAGQSQFKIRKFDLISDIHVIDNTEGAPFIAKGWFANRGDRFIIPASVFKP